MRFSTAAIGALALGVAAVPAPAANVVHEKRDYVPRGWAKRDKLPGDAELPMRIGLSQQNLDKGMDLLMDV